MPIGGRAGLTALARPRRPSAARVPYGLAPLMGVTKGMGGACKGCGGATISGRPAMAAMTDLNGAVADR